jgi:hypothetical protein
LRSVCVYVRRTLHTEQHLIFMYVKIYVCKKDKSKAVTA